MWTYGKLVWHGDPMGQVALQHTPQGWVCVFVLYSKWCSREKCTENSPKISRMWLFSTKHRTSDAFRLLMLNIFRQKPDTVYKVTISYKDLLCQCYAVYSSNRISVCSKFYSRESRCHFPGFSPWLFRHSETHCKSTTESKEPVINAFSKHLECYWFLCFDAKARIHQKVSEKLGLKDKC